MSVPKRVADRLKTSLKPYLEVLAKQRDRDVSEADTVTIVKDILSDVFGYDKYTDLTSELAIRGTFCDLGVRIEGKVRLLIEVKAIGLQLTEKHTKQAVDYAANQGIEWVVLTNGIRWILYHVIFKKPIDRFAVSDIDLLVINPKLDADLERLYLLTKEGVEKGAIAEFQQRQDATSRFVVAAILVHSEDVLAVIRREIRRVSDVLVDPDSIVQVLRDEVIKREVLEGDRAADAQRRVARTSEKSLRAASNSEPSTATPDAKPSAPEP